MSSRYRLFAGVVGLVFAFGLLYRLVPLVLGADTVARFFITEDGYLMLTAARNLAIGNGLSVSDGTIATNGVQPLATFLYTLPYLATDGDKLSSLMGVAAIMAALSVVAALAIRAFARGVLAPMGASTIWPWAVAALWFVGPLALFHSMNGLETGLYVAAVAATATYFGHITASGARYTPRQQIVLGCLCGLVFLSRIDGAIFVTALFATRAIHVLATRRLSFRDMVLEAIPPGVISLLFAAPWLLHNQIYFGSIMPISGPAQSLTATFGGNFDRIWVILFETMLPMLPIPNGLEAGAGRQLLAAVIVLGVLGVFLWRLVATRNPFRIAAIGYALFGAGIVAYYGLFFGAGHFLSRYMAPLAPLLITATAYLGLELAAKLPRGKTILSGATTLAFALAVALCLRLGPGGAHEHGHFQVVEWVEDNVSDDTWVGAIQTGTVGYWHDRTINLDGKVNPEALEARRQDGHVLNYVVASRIDVIADWVGMARWVDDPSSDFGENFDVVVEDPAQNLAVLRRRAGAGT